MNKPANTNGKHPIRIALIILIGLLLLSPAISSLLRKQRQEAQRNSCIANLRQLDGATRGWALESKRKTGDAVLPNNITPFLKGNVMPVCPAGGTYSPWKVGQDPTCTIPGHTL